MPPSERSRDRPLILDGSTFGWVTCHTFRKSVATIIDCEIGIEAVHAQLGHENSDVTRRHDEHQAALAPELTLQLEKFRPTP